MNTLKFKTNINCTGCLAQVTPALNETAGENNWTVDLQSPEKTLVVNTNRQGKDIEKAVKQAGFTADKI